jgi:hypothetical protein
MKEAELYRILMASQAELAPCSSRSLRARLIFQDCPQGLLSTRHQKGQATP